MAGNVRVIKGRKRLPEREKIFCGGPHEENAPGFLYRLTEVDGVLEAECSDCIQEVDRKWYTPEAVDAMVKEAVTRALEDRDTPPEAA